MTKNTKEYHYVCIFTNDAYASIYAHILNDWATHMHPAMRQGLPLLDLHGLRTQSSQNKHNKNSSFKYS